MVDSTNNQPDSNVAPKELALDIKGREQFNALQFVQTDANPGALTVILPDNTPDNLDDNQQIVFPDYIALASAGIPPALTLADGTVISGEEILDLIEGLDYGKVAPAAGQQGGSNSAGGGAGFTPHTIDPLGDDLNHGPYAGGYLGPRVELGEDGPVYPDDEDGSGGGGGGTPTRFTSSGSTIYLNNDVDLLWRVHTDPDAAAPPNQFIRELFAGVHTIGGLTTENGGDNTGVEHLGGGFGQVTFWSNLGGGFDDWDGGRIWLEAGETLTLTNQTASFAPGQGYWLAISDDHDPETVTPPGQPQGVLEWDDVFFTDTLGQSLSYTATTDGWHYFGAGSMAGITPNNPGATFVGHDYQTLISISPPGASAADYTVGTAGADSLTGTAGDDVIVAGDGNDTLSGGGGNDVLMGGAGDDTLTGGSGADTFMFSGTSSSGHDTIVDFTVGEGDVINLDALFDSLGVASADRVVDAQTGGGNTVLRVGVDPGGGFVDATAGTFSVTVNGSTLSDADINNLIASGNLVVDES